ncbi:AbrB/MazE/SpoVT family DNA-binding domain-containing protein [Syntrophothermus sp.]|uniref:AbrB/MazE/SpoVT family DNA-binding domain-containing protein n=1 Tax=Syntrophothermus sp. TaxID=2736299 RepID=UPI00257A69A5|nr:AbrB/MazE/SpoVT family DNA-binding domain-containing protein [Syntrophothermus sp.]
MEPFEENTTTMSSKGQVTIPQFIREKLRLSPGDKFVWELLDTGEMRVRRLDSLEAMRLTIGAEFKRRGITPEQLEALLEETRSKVFPQYLQERYKAGKGTEQKMFGTGAFREYTRKEIRDFLKADKIDPEIARKAEQLLEP